MLYPKANKGLCTPWPLLTFWGVFLFVFFAFPGVFLQEALWSVSLVWAPPLCGQPRAPKYATPLGRGPATHQACRRVGSALLGPYPTGGAFVTEASKSGCLSVRCLPVTQEREGAGLATWGECTQPSDFSFHHCLEAKIP